MLRTGLWSFGSKFFPHAASGLAFVGTVDPSGRRLYDRSVNPDDHVCLCFHVSLRKIRSYLARENPPVASLISECLSAGTGCMWCVPFLKHLHGQHRKGETPDLNVSPEQYIRDREGFRESGKRPEGGGTDLKRS